jgi:hypothetical protein
MMGFLSMAELVMWSCGPIVGVAADDSLTATGAWRQGRASDAGKVGDGPISIPSGMKQLPS